MNIVYRRKIKNRKKKKKKKKKKVTPQFTKQVTLCFLTIEAVCSLLKLKVLSALLATGKAVYSPSVRVLFDENRNFLLMSLFLNDLSQTANFS